MEIAWMKMADDPGLSLEDSYTYIYSLDVCLWPPGPTSRPTFWSLHSGELILDLNLWRVVEGRQGVLDAQGAGVDLSL